MASPQEQFSQSNIEVSGIAGDSNIAHYLPASPALSLSDSLGKVIEHLTAVKLKYRHIPEVLSDLEEINDRLIEHGGLLVENRNAMKRICRDMIEENV